jgi:hypothetical protein
MRAEQRHPIFRELTLEFYLAVATGRKAKIAGFGENFGCRLL